MSKYIELTKGYKVLVDDEDFEKLSKFSWQAIDKGGGRVYARRSKRIGKRSEGKQIIYYMHREILNAKQGEYVDHINGNTLDNRKQNLRICSNLQNSRNRIGNPNLRKYSSFKGVKKNANCSTWSARITVDGVSLYLGSYKTEQEAKNAYDDACFKYFGEFAKPNNKIQNDHKEPSNYELQKTKKS